MFINTFIGIPLPNNISKKYINLLKKIEMLGFEVESYENDIPHITLYFLGDQSKENLENIKALLLQSSFKKELVESEIVIENLNIFNKHNYVTMYLEVKLTENLKQLYETLKSKLKHFHYEERPFKPHITICRKLTTQNYIENKYFLHREIGKTKWQFKTKKIYLFGRNKLNNKMEILNNTKD